MNDLVSKTNGSVHPGGQMELKGKPFKKCDACDEPAGARNKLCPFHKKQLAEAVYEIQKSDPRICSICHKSKLGSEFPLTGKRCRDCRNLLARGKKRPCTQCDDYYLKKFFVRGGTVCRYCRGEDIKTDIHEEESVQDEPVQDEPVIKASPPVVEKKELPPPKDTAVKVDDDVKFLVISNSTVLYTAASLPEAMGMIKVARSLDPGVCLFMKMDPS